MDEELSAIVSRWVGKNRKCFWKYEVSCFRKSYKITIRNLPCPSNSDISISPAAVMSVDEKKKLSDAIGKAFANEAKPYGTCVTVTVDYSDGAVEAAVL